MKHSSFFFPAWLKDPYFKYNLIMNMQGKQVSWWVKIVRTLSGLSRCCGTRLIAWDHRKSTCESCGRDE